MDTAFELFIPGRYEDAFLYMGRIFTVTPERSLLQADLDELVWSLAATSDHRPLANLFLCHNEVLRQALDSPLLLDASIRRALQDSALSAGQLRASSDVWSSTLSLDAAFDTGSLLDLQIYNRRLYAATTHGLHSVDLADDGEDLRFQDPARRTSTRCLSVSVRFGTVIASCEERGLLASFDEFGQIDTDSTGRLDEIAADSVRTSWLGYHLVNFPGEASFAGYRATYEKVKPLTGDGASGVVITGLSPSRELLAPVANLAEHCDYLFSNHATFFAHYDDGRFAVAIRDWRFGKLGRPLVDYSGATERPLSVSSCDSGIVAEHFDRVELLRPEGTVLLHDDESIVVRTFPNSVRYTNVVLVIDDAGLHIISPVSASRDPRAG